MGTPSCSTWRPDAAPPDPPLSRPDLGLAQQIRTESGLSSPYPSTFDDTLPDVTQVADPFHLIKLANSKLDECRRRVQNDTLGHRGRKDDPLYRARRLLTKAHERLEERGEAKLTGLLNAGDPQGEVRMAWHAKEVVRSIYEITDPRLAGEFVNQLARDLQDESCPIEVNSLGRTIGRWFAQIIAWHKALVSNGPTEAVNNLVKRIKRIGFGFRRFANYRVRVLLDAGLLSIEGLSPPPRRGFRWHKGALRKSAGCGARSGKHLTLCEPECAPPIRRFETIGTCRLGTHRVSGRGPSSGRKRHLRDGCRLESAVVRMPLVGISL